MKLENDKRFFEFASNPKHKHNKSENGLFVEFVLEEYLASKAKEFARTNACGLQATTEVCLHTHVINFNLS